MHSRFLLLAAPLLICRGALAADPGPAAPSPATTGSAPAAAAPPAAAPPALAPTPAAETPSPDAPAVDEASAADSAAGAPAAEEGAPGEAPAAEAAAESAALRGPLILQAEGFDDPAAVEELRRALQTEFGCLVLLSAEESRFAPTGRLVVARQPATRELAVTFVDAAEGSATRVVEDPADPAERTRLVTLMAGTLARSPVEASETAAAVAAAPPAEPPPPTHVAVASLFYPLATNFGVPNVHTYFAFNLLYGRIGSLDGLALGMLQFASDGVQGAQVAFLGNASGGPAKGVQAALGVNSASVLEGLQLGGINHVATTASGAQIGFLNYAGDSVTGAQAAFGVNIAGDVQGGQVGFVNVARKVGGLQIGLINVAEEIDGVPIGVISVTKDGGVHPMVWYSNVTPFNAGLKFATKHTYTFVNASWAPDPDVSMIGPGGGIGGTIPAFLDKLFVDIDAGGTYLFKDSGPADDGISLLRLRGTVRYQFLQHLSVFVGGGYTGKVEREPAVGSIQGEFFYQSLGEFVAGVGL